MAKIPDHKGNKLRLGDHLLRCERTGRIIWASDARKEWNGRWVHKDWWEPKHPSLIYRETGVDKQAAPQPVRTEPTDSFTSVPGVCGYFAEDYQDLHESTYASYDDDFECG